MQGVRETARQYLPFGRFHVILGSTVRSVAPAQAAGAAAAEAPEPLQQGLGSEAEAEAIVSLLAAGQIWKSIYASGR